MSNTANVISKAQVDWADAILRELAINPDATHTAVYHLRDRSGGFISAEHAKTLLVGVKTRRASERLAKSQDAPMTRREILHGIRAVLDAAKHDAGRGTIVRRLEDLYDRATAVQDGEPAQEPAPVPVKPLEVGDMVRCIAHNQLARLTWVAEDVELVHANGTKHWAGRADVIPMAADGAPRPFRYGDRVAVTNSATTSEELSGTVSYTEPGTGRVVVMLDGGKGTVSFARDSVRHI